MHREDPCTGASAEFFPLFIANQPAGSDSIVVGNLEQNCGHCGIQVLGSTH